MSTTSQALVSVSPVSWEFGDVMIGGEPAGRIVAIAPAPDDNLDTVAGIVLDCPGFAYDLRGIALPFDVSRTCEGAPPDCATEAYRSLIFDTSFAPVAAGRQSCQLAVDLADPATDRTMELIGNGVPPPVELTMTTPSGGTIDFGDIPVGAPSTAVDVELRNDGSSGLVITNVSLSGGGVFAQSSGTVPATVDPGATTAYGVQCTPNAAQTASTSLQLTTSDPDESMLLVPVRCTGVASDARFAPGPGTFAPTVVGDTSALAITLTNRHPTNAIMIGPTSAIGSEFNVMLPATMGSLAAGASTNLTIGFAPTVDGDVTGAVEVMVNGAARRNTLIGRGRIARLSLTPGDIVDLGPICPGQSASQEVVAVATASAPIALQAPTIDNAAFAVAPIEPAAFPAPLAPVGTIDARFSVAATPTGVGDATGTMTVTTDPAVASRIVAVRALGVGTGLTVTPTALDLGAVPVEVTTGPRPVYVSNCEAEPLAVAATSLEGADAGDFMIVSQPTAALPPGATLAWTVALVPTSRGPKQAVLHIAHARGQIDVPLTGEGLDPSGRFDDDGRGSYYACSAGGDAGGAVVIALVLLGMGGRRRRR